MFVSLLKFLPGKPNEMASGGGAVCESQLRLEGGAPMMGLCPSGKRTSPLSWPCKDKARRWPSANQKPTLSMTRRCQHLDLGLLSLQKCKK